MERTATHSGTPGPPYRVARPPPGANLRSCCAGWTSRGPLADASRRRGDPAADSNRSGCRTGLAAVYGKGPWEFRPHRSHGSAGSLHNVHRNRMLHCRSSFRISSSVIWRQPAYRHPHRASSTMAPPYRGLRKSADHFRPTPGFPPGTVVPSAAPSSGDVTAARLRISHPPLRRQRPEPGPNLRRHLLPHDTAPRGSARSTTTGVLRSRRREALARTAKPAAASA